MIHLSMIRYSSPNRMDECHIFYPVCCVLKHECHQLTSDPKNVISTVKTINKLLKKVSNMNTPNGKKKQDYITECL